MDGYWNVKNLGNDLPVNIPLSRRGSMYSWTVDQFQTSVGKDCGSMNMDDLATKIFNAEETQEGLQRQGPITLPRILSQRTVDEVWKYITEEEHTNDHGGGTQIPQIKRQQTLRDVTLEEFLVRAGARGYNTNDGTSSLVSGDPNTSLGAQFQQKATVSDLMNNMVSRSHDSNLNQNVNGSMPTYQPQQPIMPKPNGYAYGTQIGFSSGLMVIGDQSLQENKRSVVPSVATIPSGHMASSSITPFPILDGIQRNNGDSSLISPSQYITSGSNSVSVRRRRNNIGIAADRRVDKKLRRKIKNRESAARSRARKQAQTMELVVEIENLKKENQELLRKQAELSKMQTNSAKGIINRLEIPPLRRTKSDIM